MNDEDMQDISMDESDKVRLEERFWSDNNVGLSKAHKRVTSHQGALDGCTDRVIGWNVS